MSTIYPFLFLLGCCSLLNLPLTGKPPLCSAKLQVVQSETCPSYNYKHLFTHSNYFIQRCSQIKPLSLPFSVGGKSLVGSRGRRVPNPTFLLVLFLLLLLIIIFKIVILVPFLSDCVPAEIMLVADAGKNKRICNSASTDPIQTLFQSNTVSNQHLPHHHHWHHHFHCIIIIINDDSS